MDVLAFDFRSDSRPGGGPCTRVLAGPVYRWGDISLSGPICGRTHRKQSCPMSKQGRNRTREMRAAQAEAARRAASRRRLFMWVGGVLILGLWSPRSCGRSSRRAAVTATTIPPAARASSSCPTTWPRTGCRPGRQRRRARDRVDLLRLHLPGMRRLRAGQRRRARPDDRGGGGAGGAASDLVPRPDLPGHQSTPHARPTPSQRSLPSPPSTSGTSTPRSTPTSRPRAPAGSATPRSPRSPRMPGSPAR